MQTYRKILSLLLIVIFSVACTIMQNLPAVPTATPILSNTPVNSLMPSFTPTTPPTVTPSLTPSPPPTATMVPTTTTPTTSSGSIQGILWHDTCAYTGGQAGEPVVLGQGCVQWGSESYQFGPNQVYDSYETGWSGVTLHIGTGACPSTGFGTSVTNAFGGYGFYVLPPGTYCVSYNPLTDGNDSILIPGGATYPQRGDAGLSRTVVVGPGENVSGVNFGYAWQFYN